MAKIITKFRYSKPTADRKIGGYAGYIATREGVEKIDDSKKYAPVTKKQREIIRKIRQSGQLRNLLRGRLRTMQ